MWGRILVFILRASHRCLLEQEILPTKHKGSAKTMLSGPLQWSWYPAFGLREDMEKRGTGKVAHIAILLPNVNTGSFPAGFYFRPVFDPQGSGSYVYTVHTTGP